MSQVLKFQSQLKFKMTRPEDRFFKLVENFVRDFHRFQSLGTLSFEDSMLRSLEMNADARMFLNIETTKDGIKLEVNDLFIYPPSGLTGYEIINGLDFDFKQKVSGEKSIISVAEIFSRIARGTLTAEQIEELFSQNQMHSLWDCLLKANSFTANLGRRLDLDRKGIHRLQHANVLFHSGKTKVITDPHLHSFYIPNHILDISLSDLPQIDAILITHFHRDHYDLSSLALFDRKTKIFFPKVRRATILCPDVERELRTLGFTDIFPLENTYQPVKIGDFTLTPTPFWGEQATTDEKPYRPDVRNIGLTYLIECEGMRSWLLADSGKDWEGDMIEEALLVRRKFGALTHIFSNLRSFHNRTPLYTDEGTTWLTLSTEQMKKHSQRTTSLSLGVAGVASILKVFPEAALFPYAHGWADYGESPPADLKEILQLLPRVSDKSKIRDWKMGDRIDYAN